MIKEIHIRGTKECHYFIEGLVDYAIDDLCNYFDFDCLLEDRLRNNLRRVFIQEIKNMGENDTIDKVDF